MFKRLTLKNFECHVNTAIDFSKGLNAIVGLSDQGKSSIRRGLEWVIFNRPLNNSMLRNKGLTQVILELDDGTVVERFRNKSNKNGYKFEGETYSALRGKVPEPIKRALKISDVNIQAQKDNYFLLNSTAGQVAKQLNKVTGLEISDAAIEAASAKVREVSQEMKSLSQRRAYLEEEIVKTDWAIHTDKKLRITEKKMVDLISLAEVNSALSEQIVFASNLKNEIERYIYVDMALLKLVKFFKAHQSLQKIEEKKASLDLLINSIEYKEKIFQQLSYVDEALRRYVDMQLLITDLKMQQTGFYGLQYNLSEAVRLDYEVKILAYAGPCLKRYTAVIKKIKNVAAKETSVENIRSTVNHIIVHRNYSKTLLPVELHETVSGFIARAREVNKKIANLLALATVIKETEKLRIRVLAAERDEEKAKDRLDKYKAEIGICPFCGAAL